MKKMCIVSEMEAMANEKVDFLSVLSVWVCVFVCKLINCSRLWKLRAVDSTYGFKFSKEFPLKSSLISKAIMFLSCDVIKNPF